MNNKNTVDVIIPSYNGLPYLKEAVKSVLSQTHKEVLVYVIDDGSKDKGATKKYIMGLADPRLRYFRKENEGPSAARNYGIEESQSPYIAFLDADDYWHKEKLEKQLALLTSNEKLGLVYGMCRVVNAQGKQTRIVPFKKRGKLFHYLLTGNKISGSASMVLTKRDIIEKVGGFKNHFWNGEDWELWLRIARDYEIDYVPQYLASVRVHSEGAQANDAKMAEGLEQIVPAMIKEFDLGIIDRGRLAGVCLKEAVFRYWKAGDRTSARRVFLRTFLYNPFTLLTRNRHILFIYLRIMVGSEWLRQARRTFSPGYRRREHEYNVRVNKKTHE
jgi:glycosyltransferase involved in cell wall biosynthesis